MESTTSQALPVYGFKKVLTHILQVRLLRNILIFSVLVFIAVPSYGILHGVPSFYRELMSNIEAEALRTTEFLSYRVFPGSRVEINADNYRLVDREISKAMRTLTLEKVKIFAADGLVIYSTDHQDEGTLNSKPYFREVVQQGRIYSKIAEKQTATVEGRIVDRDVAEVYVPLMSSGEFTGAFEVYYDITARKAIMDGLVSHHSSMSIGMAVLMFCLVMPMLVRAGRSGLRRLEIEQALKMSNERLAEQVKEQTREIRATQKASIVALASLAENYDPDTGDHLERIQSYVALLAAQLGADSPYSDYLRSRSDYVEMISLASVLHDIGKAVVPREVLTKSSKLTGPEFEQVKQHTEVAGKILHRANQHFHDSFQKDSYLAIAREVALYHHEKWNGKGYPLGLKEEDIPLSARIVSLADVYDALRSSRPYKEAWSHVEAVEEIVRLRGVDFDPVLVDTFLECQKLFEKVSNGAEGYDQLDDDIPRLQIV